MDAGSENGARLQLLLDLLEKKTTELAQILGICENQEALLQIYSQGEYSEMIVEMGREKQGLVDDILAGDSLFQKTFEEFAGFEDAAAQHPGMLNQLQKAVMNVTELDTRIRLCEQRNNALLKAQRQQTQLSEKNISQAGKEQLIDKYKQMGKKNLGYKANIPLE